MPFVRFPRAITLGLALVFISAAFAQDNDPDRIVPTLTSDIKKARADEIAKFHPKVKGMEAAVRLAAFDQRMRMEAASPFGQLVWRNIGPEVMSGRVVDIESPVGQPGLLYIAYATGGLWRSSDGGTSFTSIFDGQSTCGIGDTAFSKDGQTIWVGTGENNSQRTSYSGTGIFKSIDAGKTWKYMGLPESHHIGKILIDPRNENTVYVGVLGHLYSQNDERGVYKTTDGGKTWQHILKLDDLTGIIDLAFNPKNPDEILACAWDRDRRAWNFRESGAGSGVYRTTDAGKTWKMVQELPHAEEAGRIGVAYSKSNPSRVYVYIDNHGQNEEWLEDDERVPSGVLTPRRFLLLNEKLFLEMDKSVLEAFFKQYAPDTLKLDDALKNVSDKKWDMKEVREEIKKKSAQIFDPPITETEMIRSDDGGKTWKRTASGPMGGNSYYYFGNVIINPKDPDDVFATGTQLARTRDGGRTWRIVARGAHVDFHAVWVDPADTKHFIVGNDGGAYETRDDGLHWRHFNTLPVGQITTIAVDNKTPYNVFVGMQDNGTMKGPSTYRPGLSDLNSWVDVNGGDGAGIAVDPRENGDLIFTGSQFGSQSAWNQKTNERWSATPRGQGNRFNWVSPIIVSPNNPDVVYMGAQKLYKSTNSAKAYEAISPDLTKNKPNGNVPFSTIKDISESPLKAGVIYVGCDDGNVQMTPDDGKTWKLINTPQPDKWVSRVVASKHDAATVYCSQSGYREDDFAAYLWKSTDYGATWKSIVGDLPAETINVIREDPEHKDMLFVGTDLGVFVTFDGGVHWETLQGGLPHVPVHDIAIQAREKDLVIGTHARSAFVLNLKYLYDLTPELRTSDLKLMPVDNMRRDRNWGYSGGGRGGGIFSEPVNPVVRMNFYAKGPGKATLRIKDSTGKVVKTQQYDATSGYNFAQLELKIAEAGPWPTGEREIKTAADILKDPFESGRPKYLPAGDYTLEVELNGKTVAQAWKLTAPS